MNRSETVTCDEILGMNPASLIQALNSVRPTWSHEFADDQALHQFCTRNRHDPAGAQRLLENSVLRDLLDIVWLMGNATLTSKVEQSLDVDRADLRDGMLPQED